MRWDLANMLRQVRQTIDPKHAVYAFSLEELEKYVRQVRDGTLSLDEFADFYMIRPSDHLPAHKEGDNHAQCR